MCTVSVVPLDEGFRLVCNRDELVARAVALPPRHHRLGSASAVFPIDPDGGGTWIGINDTGLVMAILNGPAAQPAKPGRPGLRSRGAIIPALLRHGSVAAAVRAARAFFDSMETETRGNALFEKSLPLRATLGRNEKRSSALEPTDFAPFHLVAIQSRNVSIVNWDGALLATSDVLMTAPLLFTSTSFGDTPVEPPRRRLFVASVIHAPDSWLEGQRRFHEHRWPYRPDVSVRMRRPGARTVSRSVVDVAPARATFEYEPLFGEGRDTARKQRQLLDLRTGERAARTDRID